MIVRDRDVLIEVARRAGVSVSFSVPTIDADVWRRTEPGTAPPAQRLKALEKLVGAGIRCGISMAPIIPGLSDRPSQLEDVVRAARDAGAAYLWVNVLYLKEGTREHFMESVERHWPELLPAFQADYATRAYLPAARTKPVQELVGRLSHDLGLGRQGHTFIEPVPSFAPEQLSLLAG
jgi:DNA repair photolyase